MKKYRKLQRFIAALATLIVAILSPKASAQVNARHHNGQPSQAEQAEGRDRYEHGNLLLHTEPFGYAVPDFTIYAPSVNVIGGPQDQYKAQEGDDEGEWYTTFANHPTDWLLVLFNSILAVFTIGLYKATKGLWKAAQEQSRDTKTSLEAARESNNVAKDAAVAAARNAKAAEDALTHTRRPYLLVESCRCNADQIIQHGTRTPPAFFYRLRNFGGTPAIIVSVWADTVVSARIPIVDYLKASGGFDEYMIVRSDKESEDFVAAYQSELTTDVFDDVARMRKRLWLVGQVTYEGIFYEKYITCFCFMGAENGAAYPDGGPDYNVRT